MWSNSHQEFVDLVLEYHRTQVGGLNSIVSDLFTELEVGSWNKLEVLHCTSCSHLCKELTLPIGYSSFIFAH